MDSMRRSTFVSAALCLVVIGTQLSESAALVASQDSNPPYPKAISDLKEAIVKGLGLQGDESRVSGFDLRDALVGKSVAYEFDLEIDGKVLPLKLLEDVNRWEYVDLPVFQMDNPIDPGEENGLLERRRIDDQTPLLPPFQLAGPMELWIQDAKNMRISLPHDVDAGVLKKVILSDGAVVTVKGARSVTLRHPIELPLTMNRTNDGSASSLLNLAEYLQDVARSHDGPLVSLRIVGPTSLSSSSSPSNRLKLKRLAPGLVELSSASKQRTLENDDVSPIDLVGQSYLRKLWPFVSINGSNSNLLGFETLLSSVLGGRAGTEGSFKLLKADVSAETFVKIGFGVEKKLKEGDLEGIPEWRTKPSSVRLHFEVLGKVDGSKIVPEKVVQLKPLIAEDTFAPNLLLGNVSMSKMPVVHQPPNAFML